MTTEHPTYEEPAIMTIRSVWTSEGKIGYQGQVVFYGQLIWGTPERYEGPKVAANTARLEFIDQFRKVLNSR